MVELEQAGGVARIFLNRSEKVNALDSPHLDELAEKLAAAGKDEATRVVVLGGRGTAFCGGADIEELARLTSANAGVFVGRIHRVCEAIRKLPLPVVARLQGAVLGAGLEIAASCDLRIAAEGTRFAMPEVRLGIPSVVEAALLPRLVGSGRAAWLVLTGEAIDARRALDWGLVEEVAPQGGLDESLDKLVVALVAADRQALRVQKALLQLWDEAPLATSVGASMERFAQSYASGVPNELMRRILDARKKA